MWRTGGGGQVAGHNSLRSDGTLRWRGVILGVEWWEYCHSQLLILNFLLGLMLRGCSLVGTRLNLSAGSGYLLCPLESLELGYPTCVNPYEQVGLFSPRNLPMVQRTILYDDSQIRNERMGMLVHDPDCHRRRAEGTGKKCVPRVLSLKSHPNRDTDSTIVTEQQRNTKMDAGAVDKGYLSICWAIKNEHSLGVGR